MSAQTAFHQMLKSLSCELGGVVYFAHDKFSEVELSLFLQHGLISKASDAEYLNCMGCELGCYKKVEIERQRGKREVHAFIVCTEPEDGGGEIVELSRLVQYQASQAGLAQVVIHACGRQLAGSLKAKAENAWDLGVFSGKKHKAVLSLDFKQLKIQVNQTEFEMVEVLGFDERRGLTLDAVKIAQCVDKGFAPASGSQKNVLRISKTQKRYEAWNSEAKKMKQANNALSKSNIAKRIAKLPMAEKKDARTIANNLKI